MSIYEIIGFTSAILIAIAFYLNIKKITKTNDPLYLYLNIFGSLGLVMSTYMTQSYPAMGMNIFWFIVSTYGLFRRYY